MDVNVMFLDIFHIKKLKIQWYLLQIVIFVNLMQW